MLAPAGQKMGLVEIDGEPYLAPQDGELLAVPVTAGRFVWDGVDQKARTGFEIPRKRDRCSSPL